jgi:RHS repeat-associated protein
MKALSRVLFIVVLFSQIPTTTRSTSAPPPAAYSRIRSASDLASLASLPGQPLTLPPTARNIGGAEQSAGVASMTTATGAPCHDFTNDGQVDSADVQAIQARWKQRSTDPQWDARFDLNGDGIVNIVDIMQVTVALGPCLPPDPALVASPIDRTIATDIFAATSFLYTGLNPIQTGVVPGTIAAQRVAVLRGKVFDLNAQPLPGVTITVLNHPEYGQTLSRADGTFDLVVNGGGLLTIKYVRSDLLPVQRQVTPPWRDYTWLPEIVLLPYDPTVTTIDLHAASAMQVAQGSVISDGVGLRQATLLVPAGTQAEMILPDGTTQPLATLNVRATEYTVGGSGPNAMPGELPANSGYTYAVELSVDEAVAAGATEVRFSQPLPFYLQDFIGFPVGGAVPTGYYDRQRGRWVPSENGRVVKLVSITGNMADLDTDGDGLTDNAPGLGISDTERQRLATLYAPGQQLWRVPIAHFSPWDMNWPFGLPGDAEAPTQSEEQSPQIDNPICVPGSIIECENQVLGENVDVAGTPFQLNYRSNRVVGRKENYQVHIPLTGNTFPASLFEVRLEIEIAGTKTVQVFKPQPNLEYTLVWDGKDAYGRTVQGSELARIHIGYTYIAAYYPIPADFQRSFARFPPGTAFGGNRVPRSVPASAGGGGGGGGGGGVLAIIEPPPPQKITLWNEWLVSVGTWVARDQDLAGWGLNIRHMYDPYSKKLYLGDGTWRSIAASEIIRTVAGDGGVDFEHDGVPATATSLRSAADIAVGPDGRLYIADSSAKTVRRVDSNGIITTIAGNPDAPDNTGDGGPATQAGIGAPTGVAVGPDGNVYIASRDSSTVRRVSPDGIITTVAGTGVAGFSGDDGPATAAQLDRPWKIALGPDGSLYIADYGNMRIRRVGVDGVITTVAGDGALGVNEDNIPATSAHLGGPAGIAVGPDGSLYILEFLGGHVLKVSPEGLLTTVAGLGGFNLGESGPALSVGLWSPQGIAIDPEGTLYIADTGANRIRSVSLGFLRTLVGSTPFGDNPAQYDMGDGGLAAAAHLSTPSGVAVGPGGNLYIADSGHQRIRRVSSSLSAVSSADLIIPSEDGGELYIFSPTGRHLRTLDALTGAVRYTFGYDTAGRLGTVTDGDGNSTTIERDGNGIPVAIVGPYGQRTGLSIETNGYLGTITDPAGQSYHFTYAANGLMQSMTDPRGNASDFAYEDLGRLARDTNAAAGFTQLDKIGATRAFTVTKTTAEGYTTQYGVDRTVDGREHRINTFPNGLSSDTVIQANGTTTTRLPDGMRTSVTEGPDPHWGMLAPIAKTITSTTPSGRSFTIATTQTSQLANQADPLSLTTLNETVTVNGRAYTSLYDAASRTFNLTTPTGRQSSSTIDIHGRIKSEQAAGLDPLVYGYDLRGRLASITQGSDATARTTTFSYNDQGYLASITDPLSHTTSFTYDPVGRVTRQTLPDERVIGYAYDENGNLISITPPGRPAHQFSYTQVDQPADYTPPNVGIGSTQTQYRYNRDGQLTQIIRPDGQTLGFGYDSAGRLATLTTPRGQTRYTYNPATGQLAAVTDPDGGTLSYAYDGSLVTSETLTGSVAGDVGFAYDDDFRVNAIGVNRSMTVTLQYDADSLLTGAGDLTLSHNAQNGLLSGSTLGSVADTWNYNGLGEPMSYSAAISGTAQYGVQYTRDKLGRISAKTETFGDITSVYSYTYNLSGRLVEVKKDGAVVESYQYDPNGNRLSATVNGTTLNGSYDDQDRMLHYGATSYTYTANGELTSKTNGTNGGEITGYQYDVLGNLISVGMPDGRQIGYMIDGSNRRVGKRINGTLVQGFLYQNQLNPVAELDGANNVVSRFVYASRANVPDYMIKGGVTYRIITDQFGSPRLVVNAATGEIVQRMDYDAFGNVVRDTNPGFQPFGFAGGLYDRDTGLVRFGARDYDAEVGRWTAKDPIGFAGRDMNVYGYASNNPINTIDVYGLDPWYGNYVGPGNNGYDTMPIDMLDHSARTHDIAYDQLNANGVSDALFNTELIGADFRLARESLAIALLVPDPMQQVAAFATGMTFGAIVTFKSGVIIGKSLANLWKSAVSAYNMINMNYKCAKQQRNSTQSRRWGIENAFL